jgi:hypothetical protein
MMSCAEDNKDPEGDTIPQATITDCRFGDSLTSAIVDSTTTAATTETKTDPCEVKLHPVCLAERRWLDACATVIVRPHTCSDVADFSKRAFRAWLGDQSGHGLLVYLGTDTSGSIWTIEVTQADASGYYFAYFYRRSASGKTTYRSLLDSQSDCGEDASDKQMSYPFGKRVDIYVEEYGLQNLTMDSCTTEIPDPGTIANDEGAGYEEQKLTIRMNNGKVHRFFFIEGTSMCWSTYSWEMR